MWRFAFILTYARDVKLCALAEKSAFIAAHGAECIEAAKGLVKVAVGCCLQRSSSLGQNDPSDIFVHDRAADVQAVPVSVGHVSKRNFVEREAELNLIDSKVSEHTYDSVKVT